MSRPMETRPLLWSVRREVWENRSIWAAPLVVAAISLFAYAMSTIGLAERRRAVLKLALEQQRAAVSRSFDMVAMVLFGTAFIVGLFYCLDALHSERRDRSILFWKSLPVSDLTTVLSKMAIPLVVVPAITFLTMMVTQTIMVLEGNAVLLAHGMRPTTYAQLPLLTEWAIALYGTVALALWHAPVYAWFLLVSGWAKRAAVLWAVLPFAAIGVIEQITIGGSRFQHFLRRRLFGGVEDAFAFSKDGDLASLSQLTPGRYLSTPGLWLGLAFAAACVFAAVRLRRRREPL